MKYTLPEGIQVKQPLPDSYNKETKLVFIDPVYGEYVSTIRAVTQANGSMHPEVKKQRQKEKFKRIAQKKWGVDNPSQIESVVTKRVNNIKSKDLTIKNPEIDAKRRNTMLARYGVDNHMDSSEIRDRMKNSIIEKYGVDNIMKLDEYKQRMSKPLSNETKIKIYESRQSNKTLGTSKEEKELKEFIHSLGFINADKGYFGGSNPCEVDIKIKEKQIAIEYNGLYYHCVGGINKCITKDYHLNKTNIANSNGYRLIHVYDYEWNKRKAQVKSFLKSALGVNTVKIYGRNTTIKIVDKQVARDFLEKYHILGSCAFIDAFGLYLDNELLSLITISRHHRGLDEFTLSRYVGKEDVNVLGGLSKLTNYALNKYNMLTTWIDLRYSTGDNWLKCGWKLVHRLKPDYIYFNLKTSKVVSKQMRRKKVIGTPDHITEAQHAEMDGLKKVYDCGKLKLIIQKK